MTILQITEYSYLAILKTNGRYISALAATRKIAHLTVICKAGIYV